MHGSTGSGKTSADHARRGEEIQLVDFQLYRKNGDPVGERVSTSLNPKDRASVEDFFRRIVVRDWDCKNPDPRDYSIRFWRHKTDEEILTLSGS